MTKKITKAIFPVAGLGTRFLPATKSVPKEILPLVDRPLVQYAVDEAREAGIEEFIFISARGKSAVADYFDTYPALERKLREDKKFDLLNKLESSNMHSGSVAFVRQGEPLGLGHAVACARKYVTGDEYFAVLLPDDVIFGQPGCLKQMVEIWKETSGNMVGVMEVPPEEISSYGCLDVETESGQLLKARGLVEKPNEDEAPSNYAVIGRYLLCPSIMDSLALTKPGANGEIQLTDALDKSVKAGQELRGFKFSGERYDCGSHLGFVKATLKFGMNHPDMKEELFKFMSELAGKA